MRHPAGVRATLIALLVILVAIAASVGWTLRNRAARQMLLNQQVNQVLEEVKQLYESGKTSEAMSSLKRTRAS